MVTRNITKQHHDTLHTIRRMWMISAKSGYEPPTPGKNATSTYLDVEGLGHMFLYDYERTPPMNSVTPGGKGRGRESPCKKC